MILFIACLCKLNPYDPKRLEVFSNTRVLQKTKVHQHIIHDLLVTYGKKQCLQLIFYSSLHFIPMCYEPTNLTIITTNFSLVENKWVSEKKMNKEK